MQSEPKQVPDLPTEPTPDDLIDKQTVLQRFFISDRTLQNWRSKRLIHYYPVGKKYYYSEAEIVRMIRSKKKVQLAMLFEATPNDDLPATTSGSNAQDGKPTARKPFFKRHRYYSEKLVLIVLFMFWLLMPKAIAASSLLKSNTQYGFGVALLIRLAIEFVPRRKSKARGDADQEVVDNAIPKELRREKEKVKLLRWRYIWALLMIAGLMFGGFIHQLNISTSTIAAISQGVIVISAICVIAWLVYQRRKGE